MVRSMWSHSVCDQYSLWCNKMFPHICSEVQSIVLSNIATLSAERYFQYFDTAQYYSLHTHTHTHSHTCTHTHSHTLHTHTHTCTYACTHAYHSNLFKWLRLSKNKVTKLFKSASHYSCEHVESRGEHIGPHGRAIVTTSRLHSLR